MHLLSRVSEFAARHRLWRPDTRVIGAVSGGSDSVALLCLLHDLQARGELVLDCVAHLNHQIRGEEADEDERFCRDLARRLGHPFGSVCIDVPADARHHHISLEMAARRARRRFLGDLRKSRGADVIATAHTADDQAETVLLRMARGTGLRGLGGIAPIRDGFVRPLLSLQRQELRDELCARGERWREDSTNSDLSYPRNRMRHQLIPYLEEHFNPAVRKSLARLSELARADEALLDRTAVSAAFGLVSFGDDGVRIDAAGLNALPEAVARRAIRYALEASRHTAPDLDAVEKVRAVVAGTETRTTISGLGVEHSGGSVVLVPIGATAPQRVPFRLDLPIPGVVEVPGAACVLEAQGPIERGYSPRGHGRPNEVEVAADTVGAQLIVRSRLPGDRLRPLGLGGQKKVQDVLVDRKVPRDQRDLVPIVTDREGRIVWVAGHALGEEFRVTDRTNTVVILKLRRLERLGT